MENSESELYRRLYYQAFNRFTQLQEQIQQMQQELEELYLCLQEDQPEDQPE